MLATVEQIEASLREDSSLELRSQVCHAVGQPAWSGYVIKREDIETFLNTSLAGALNRTIFKGVRPWEIVDMAAALPKDKAWIGIEYETGFSTKRAYNKVVNYIWNEYNNTALDMEGCGQHPLEITFPPVSIDDFAADTHFINKTVEFFNTTAGLKQDRPDDYQEVGIHCNISTPSYRSASWSKREDVKDVLNTSLGTLSDTQLDLVFNRTPYAGFFNREDHNANTWIEGKLFNSTDDLDEVKKYKLVIARLANLIEVLSTTDLEDATRWDEDCEDEVYYVISNFFDILTGKTEVPELEYTSDTNCDFFHW